MDNRMSREHACILSFVTGMLFVLTIEMCLRSLI